MSLARWNAPAPIPVWSSNSERFRLNRGGNRQVNAALHRNRRGRSGVASARSRLRPGSDDGQVTPRPRRCGHCAVGCPTSCSDCSSLTKSPVRGSSKQQFPSPLDIGASEGHRSFEQVHGSLVRRFTCLSSSLIRARPRSRALLAHRGRCVLGAPSCRGSARRRRAGGRPSATVRRWSITSAAASLRNSFG